MWLPQLVKRADWAHGVAEGRRELTPCVICTLALGALSHPTRSGGYSVRRLAKRGILHTYLMCASCRLHHHLMWHLPLLSHSIEV